MAIASWIFQVTLLGCIFWTSAKPIISANNGGRYVQNSTANITCKIQPYDFNQEWRVNKEFVAGCIIDECAKSNSSDSRYLFHSDRNNGIFVFIIKGLQVSDNGTVIGCYDGNITDDLVLIVTDQTESENNRISEVSDSWTSDYKCWVKNRWFMILLLIATPFLFLQTWLALCLQDNHKCQFKCVVLLLGLLSPGIGVFAKSLMLQGCKCKCKFDLHLASKPCFWGIGIWCLCMFTLQILQPVLCIGCDVHTIWLYIIGGINLILIYLYGGCFTLYVACKSEKASVTTENETHEGEHSETETMKKLSAYTAKLTCDECTTRMSIKSYCIDCNKFLCNSCDACKHSECTRLRHLQHEANATEADIPCAHNHKSTKQTHGYCLTCSMYLCTQCLIKEHHTHVLLWIPSGDVTKNDRLCCYKGHTDRKEETVLGYCIQCDIYVCLQCTKRHDGHKLIMHHKQAIKFKTRRLMSSQTSEVNYEFLAFSSDVSKTCEYGCKFEAECFLINSQSYLCSDCYERKGANSVLLGRIKDAAFALDENKQKCKIHQVFGRVGKTYTADVYCLICNLYMCKDCFEHHKRLKESWIRTHKDNLFTCKKCQARKNVFPVECLLLNPVMLLCSECFESGSVSSNDVLKIYDEDVMEKIQSLIIKTPCQIHMLPFLKHEAETESSVYCLMCKMYMCKDCFLKHRRFNNITKPTPNENERNEGTYVDEGRPLPPILPSQDPATVTVDKRTSSTCTLLLKIFGFIPVVGILFTLGCIVLGKKFNMNTTGKVNEVQPGD